MQQAINLRLEQLGARATIIPGPEPRLPGIIEVTGEIGLATKRIPVAEPQLDGNEERYVLEALRTGWISSAGSFIRAFEELFATRVGARYGVACSSGTTALQLALATLGIGPGDEVIIPTFTMIATANAVRYLGAEVILVDAENETYTLDVTQLEMLITPRTKAIVPVHVYGHPVDMDPVLQVAEKHGLNVVSDAAEAHGAEYKGNPIGGVGTCAIYSFYANKIITTGEGGMITTNSPEFANLARTLRDHAFSPERHFWHKYLGYNFRMTNLQAALGLAQTERFDQLVTCHRRNAELYSERLRNVTGLTLPQEKPWAKNVFWMYGILVQPDFGLSRDMLRQRLAKCNIETRTFFIPIHLQPIYFHKYGTQSFPVAEALCQKGLYLPSASTLAVSDIDFVTRSIIDIHLENT